MVRPAKDSAKEIGSAKARPRELSFGEGQHSTESGRNSGYANHCGRKRIYDHNNSSQDKCAEGKAKATALKEKKKGEERKQGEKQPEIVAIESYEESDAELMIDEQAKGTPKQSAGTGLVMQSTSSNSSAAPRTAAAQTSLEVEQEEEEVEAEVAMEIIIPAPEELAMAVAGPPTPTSGPIYYATGSIPTPTPVSTTVSSPTPS